MMEVVDESTLEEELKEADKVDWSSLSHPYLILITPTRLLRRGYRGT